LLFFNFFFSLQKCIIWIKIC